MEPFSPPCFRFQGGLCEHEERKDGRTKSLMSNISSVFISPSLCPSLPPLSLLPPAVKYFIKLFNTVFQHCTTRPINSFPISPPRPCCSLMEWEMISSLPIRKRKYMHDANLNFFYNKFQRIYFFNPIPRNRGLFTYDVSQKWGSRPPPKKK